MTRLAIVFVVLSSQVNVAFVELGVVTTKLPTFGHSASVVNSGPSTHAVAPVEQYHTLICHSYVVFALKPNTNLSVLDVLLHTPVTGS